MSLFFDNATELIAELRQLLEQTVSHLGRISENTERDIVREQRVTIREQAVYDAAGLAIVEIAAPLGSSLEIKKMSSWPGGGAGFATKVYLNAVGPANQLHNHAGGAIFDLGEELYVNDGEKLLFVFEGGAAGEVAFVNAQGKRYLERVGA